SRAIAEADSSAANAAQELAEQRVQYETLLRDMEQEQAKVEFQLRSARIAAEAAERVSFKNFDENNFLRIHAPISGVVTDVPLMQRGDKVQSSKPLVSIAPSDTQRILQVQIPESERGFLRIGQAVKVKVNAFPYQTYGSIDGTLDALSRKGSIHLRRQNPSKRHYHGKREPAAHGMGPMRKLWLSRAATWNRQNVR
ncbi:MAG: HlyD family efflux transporter periplasmic adaptor subunit, partial [Pseudohongiellaceae bacterium]